VQVYAGRWFRGHERGNCEGTVWHDDGGTASTDTEGEYSQKMFVL
jgi:hypothetical protein